MKARFHSSAVLTVTRKVLGHKKVVYLLIANRPIRYPRGKSQIAYIGTTSKGLARVASSVAYRAQDILSGYGLSSMEVFIVTCPPATQGAYMGAFGACFDFSIRPAFLGTTEVQLSRQEFQMDREVG